MRVTLNPQITLELVDNEFMALDSRSGSIHRIQGDVAPVLRQVSNAKVVDMPESEALRSLIDIGILDLAEKAPKGVTRRQVLGLFGGTVGAGVLTFALPSVAVASSAGIDFIYCADGADDFLVVYFNDNRPAGTVTGAELFIDGAPVGIPAAGFVDADAYWDGLDGDPITATIPLRIELTINGVVYSSIVFTVEGTPNDPPL